MHKKVLDYLKEEIGQYLQKSQMEILPESNTLVSLYIMFLIDGTMLHLLLDEKYKDNVYLWEIIKKSVSRLISSPFN